MSPGQPSLEPRPGQSGQLRDLAEEPTRSSAKSLLVFVPGLLAERVPYAELLSRLEQDLGQGWRVLWWDSGLRWWMLPAVENADEGDVDDADEGC